jgi:hypothetical protein
MAAAAAAAAAVVRRELSEIGRLERILWSAMCTAVCDEDTSVERKFNFCGCMAVIQYHARSLRVLFGEHAISTLPEAAQLRQLCLALYHSHVSDTQIVCFYGETAAAVAATTVWLREQCAPLFRVILCERVATNKVETIKDWFESTYANFTDHLLRSPELFRLTFLHYQVALRLTFVGDDSAADAQYRLLKEHSPFASAKLWENWFDAQAATVACLTSCATLPIKAHAASAIDPARDVESIAEEEPVRKRRRFL